MNSILIKNRDKNWPRETIQYILNFTEKNLDLLFQEIVSDKSLKAKMIALGNSFYRCALEDFREDYHEIVNELILGLSCDEYEKLVKFYVLAGANIPDLNRGSVSGAIWLMKMYRPKDQKRLDNLIAWIFMNRSHNYYLPFGSAIHTSNMIKSERDYIDYINARDWTKSQLKKANAEFQLEEHKNAVFRKSAIARENIEKAIARNDIKAVEALQKTIDKENDFK